MMEDYQYKKESTNKRMNRKYYQKTHKEAKYMEPNKKCVRTYRTKKNSFTFTPHKTVYVRHNSFHVYPALRHPKSPKMCTLPYPFQLIF